MGHGRRRYPRWEVDESVYCYIDGSRLDAQSLDISSGGMFLETENEAMPGTNVILVFQTQFSSADFPIFLVGRVMRRQASPTQGLGLRWLGASTQGNELQLALFLRKVLKIQDPNIERKPVGRKAIFQSCFEFSTETKTTAESSDVEAKPQRAVRAGSRKLADIPVQLIFSESPKQRRAKFIQAEDADGPLTQKTRRKDSLAPVDIHTAVEIRGRSLDVHLEYLGLEEAWMVGQNLPGTKGDEVVLTIPVTTRGGQTEVRCCCEILGIDLVSQDLVTTLEVMITSCEEEREKGIFFDYVRWLHFNAIRSA